MTYEAASQRGRDINSGLPVPSLFHWTWQETRFCNMKLRVSCQSCRFARNTLKWAGYSVFWKHPSQASTQIRGKSAELGCCPRLPRTSQGASGNLGLFIYGAPLIFTAFHVEKLMLLLANHFLHDSHTEPPLLQNLFLIKTFSLLS